jgi:hypothetical protein
MGNARSPGLLCSLKNDVTFKITIGIVIDHY